MIVTGQQYQQKYSKGVTIHSNSGILELLDGKIYVDDISKFAAICLLSVCEREKCMQLSGLNFHRSQLANNKWFD